jgi:hypothetical protein
MKNMRMDFVIRPARMDMMQTVQFVGVNVPKESMIVLHYVLTQPMGAQMKLKILLLMLWL